MNERIRELVEKALFESEVEYYFDDERDVKITMDIFAELLIRECARRCEDIAIKHQVEETTYAAGKKAGAFECAKDLKQHFGVQ